MGFVLAVLGVRGSGQGGVGSGRGFGCSVYKLPPVYMFEMNEMNKFTATCHRLRESSEDLVLLFDDSAFRVALGDDGQSRSEVMGLEI